MEKFYQGALKITDNNEILSCKLNERDYVTVKESYYMRIYEEGDLLGDVLMSDTVNSEELLKAEAIVYEFDKLLNTHKEYSQRQKKIILDRISLEDMLESIKEKELIFDKDILTEEEELNTNEDLVSYVLKNIN